MRLRLGILSQQTRIKGSLVGVQKAKVICLQLALCLLLQSCLAYGPDVVQLQLPASLNTGLAD